jgi:hypothetical protein
MPVYGPGSGRNRRRAAGLYAPQAPGNSHCAPIASDSMARTAASRRSRRVHEGLPSEQNSRLRAGIAKETEDLTLVSTRHSASQFPLHPYSAAVFGRSASPHKRDTSRLLSRRAGQGLFYGDYEFWHWGGLRYVFTPADLSFSSLHFILRDQRGEKDHRYLFGARIPGQ